MLFQGDLARIFCLEQSGNDCLRVIHVEYIDYFRYSLSASSPCSARFFDLVDDVSSVLEHWRRNVRLTPPLATLA